MKFYIFGTQSYEVDHEDFNIDFITTDAKEAKEYRKTFGKLYNILGVPGEVCAKELHYNFSFKKCLKELKEYVKEYEEEEKL